MMNSIRFPIQIRKFQSAWIVSFFFTFHISVFSNVGLTTIPDQILEAELFYDKGEFHQCLKLVNESLDHTTLTPNNLYQVLLLKSAALQHLGRLQSAYESLRKIQDRFDALKRQQQIEFSLRASDLYLSVGRDKEALEYAEKAHSLATDLDDPKLLSSSFNALGNVFMTSTEMNTNITEDIQLGRDVHAALASERLVIAKRGRRAIGIKQPTVRQARAKNALEYYTKCVEIAVSTNHQSMAARATINKARAAVLLKDFDFAIREIQASILHMEKLPNYFEKGFCYLSLGMLAKELDDLNTNSPPDLDLSQFTWELIQEVKKIGQSLSNAYLISFSNGILGQLYEENFRFEEAVSLTKSAIFFAQQQKNPEILYRWQWQLGRLLARLDEVDLAIVQYDKAITTLDSIRNALSVGYRKVPHLFKKRVKPLYYELAELYIRQAENFTDRLQEQNHLRQAREVIEAMKSAELQDLFQDPCVTAYKEKKVLLDAFESNIAVLYPIALENRLVLLVSISDRLHLFSIPVKHEIFSQVARRYRAVLQDETSRDFHGESKRLYDWIIRPLENELVQAKITTLVIVPDGVLSLVPISTLHDGNQFLIEKYAIVTTPGLKLVSSKPLTRHDFNAIMFGLSQSNQDYAPLPGVESELKEIQGIINAKVCKNEEFTSSRVAEELQGANYQLIHIATHGKFNSNPEESFLLTYDQKLTLNALEDLIKFSKFRDEPLELLTLSACQTAVGNEKAALGLAGVAVKSGARSVLASLWYIDDAATTELITEFYSQYFTSMQVSKAQALQIAQKKLIASEAFNHPSQWAAFLVIGNWL